MNVLNSLIVDLFSLDFVLFFYPCEKAFWNTILSGQQNEPISINCQCSNSFGFVTLSLILSQLQTLTFPLLRKTFNRVYKRYFSHSKMYWPTTISTMETTTRKTAILTIAAEKDFSHCYFACVCVLVWVAPFGTSNWKQSPILGRELFFFLQQKYSSFNNDYVNK